MYKYILIVDDDISLAYSIKSCLRAKEKKIFTVNDAITATQLLTLYSFDLIISDVMMPHHNGYDLLYYVRLSQDLCCIPFVFLTAKGMTSDRIKGYSLGCNIYLVKPFHPSELVSVVDNLLSFQNTHKIILSSQSKEKAFRVKMTFRELSVLRLLVKGMMNKEIADNLSLSTRSVEKYVSRLLSKAKARNRTELAQLFLLSKSADF